MKQSKKKEFDGPYIPPVLDPAMPKINILYQDENLLAVSKPISMAVHPGPDFGRERDPFFLIDVVAAMMQQQVFPLHRYDPMFVAW
jgi:23S rRNA-/tRNA-specific pseudouridylate synthase